MNTDKHLFGTDGIRGVIGKDPLTEDSIEKIGYCIASIMHKTNKVFIVGRDTRKSGKMIENALIKGIAKAGCRVLTAGIIPTSAISFLTTYFKTDGGVAITASHNPSEDNGIKIFNNTGIKLDMKTERKIESMYFKNDRKNKNIYHGPKIEVIQNASTLYENFCLEPFKKSEFKFFVILDCSNGATYKVAPRIFRQAGCKVKAISISPNGENINKNCGSEYPEKLKNKIKREKADVGFAFDGDGDRVIAITSKGSILNGDHIMTILADHLIKDSTEKKIVITPMSNLGLYKFLEKKGYKIFEAPVGDRNVIYKMIEKDAFLGGEQSGHIIIRNYHTTGDGIITALYLLAIMHRTGKTLDELSSSIHFYPQVLENIPVKSKVPFEKIPGFSEEMKKAHDLLKCNGRIIVRYSGTQNICRIMVEAEKHKIAKRIAKELASIITKELS